MHRLPTSAPWSLTLERESVPIVAQFLNGWLPLMGSINEVELIRPRMHQRLTLAHIIENKNRKAVWLNDLIPHCFVLTFAQLNDTPPITSVITASLFTNVRYTPGVYVKEPGWQPPSQLLITWKEGLQTSRLRIVRF